MTRFKLVIALFLFGFSENSNGQQNDFVTWNYLNFNYKLNENLSIGFSEHHMRNKNATETWLFLHDLSINHRLSQHLSHELHTRLIQQKRLDDNFQEREMMYYAVQGKWKVIGINIGARSRWQGMVYGNHFDDQYKGPFFYHRFRISLTKNISYRWHISSNVEFFQPLNRPQRSYIDQIRLGFLVSNKLNKHITIDHSFQIQQQKNRSNPYQYFVLGIGCNFAW
ncbi:MAG: hypothetical protein RL609_1802 [Bacteroidota bacterium]|jgi:hypothetical protein